MAGGLYSISNKISQIEQEAIAKFGDDATKVGEYVRPLADDVTSTVEQWQRIVYHIGFTLIPCLLILVCFIWIKKTYKITEESHIAMVKELENRHKITEDNNVAEELENE